MREPAKSERQKNRPLWAAIVIGAVAGLVVLATMVLAVYGGASNVAQQSVFAAGTQVDGIEMGGMREAEGRQRVLDKTASVLDAISIELTFDGVTRVFDARDLGVSSDAGELVDAAYTYNKSGDLLSDFNRTQVAPNLSSRISIDKEAMVEAVGAFLNANTREAVDATVRFDAASRTFSYTRERAGIVAHTEEVCAELENRILSGNYAPLDVTEAFAEVLAPAVTSAELERNTALLVQFQTVASDNPNRNINIDLMCKAVDGLVLAPGETLSLNELVGQRTIAKGFTVAPAIVDGQLTDDVGGGICQLAGTLYNAALLADMEIVERVHHTWPSDYLPVGLDATLNWNNKDLKIKNRSQYPIYISAERKERIVSVEIYGQPPEEGVEIVIENRIIKQIEAPAPQVIYTDKLHAGERKTMVKSRPGYEVEIYRHRLMSGTVVQSELISRDHFRTVEGTMMVGTNEIIK